MTSDGGSSRGLLKFALGGLFPVSSTNPAKQEIGTATGGVIGGAAGAVLTGGSTLGKVGGAAVGGVIGNQVGKDLDKKK